MMNIRIDGQSIEVLPGDKNLVDITDRSRISLPAPCYHAKQSKGCCHGCVVEISGEHKYACSTTPVEGMEVIVDKEDLKTLRKERLLKYQEGIKSGNPCGCECSDKDCS